MRNKFINFIFILTLISVICIPFVNQINDITKYFLNIWSNISYSFIVAYIFYIVVLIPEIERKRKFHDFIVARSNLIVTTIDQLLKMMMKDTNISDLSGSSIQKLCSTLQLSGEVPVLYPITNPITFKKTFQHYTWAEYVVYIKKEIEHYISELFVFSSVIDENLFNALYKFKESFFFKEADIFLSQYRSTGNKDFSVMYKQFIELNELKESLDTVNKQIAKKYKFKIHESMPL